ncbi:MAG: hypothetical protein LUF35_05700 [Lachnospiraceae bacterium]|nr:hypothetical protein [Lachnospiraceae bacterium]
MIEDYDIRMRNFRMVPTGNFEITRNGKKVEIRKGRDIYATAKGEFLPKEWKDAALAEIERCGEMDILHAIEHHVRENCVWLHKESEIEEYAIECHCCRAYLHWPEWQENAGIAPAQKPEEPAPLYEDGGTIIWM